METSTLLDASFRGVAFDCQSTADPTKRALAVHEYPFKDGGEVDDMGRRARTFPVTAVFFGDEYLAALKTFVEALDEGGEGELVHPVFGAHTVAVQEYEIKHDADNPDSCSVSVVFVESGLHTPFFSTPGTAKGKAQNAADGAAASLDEAKEGVAAGLAEWMQSFLGENPASNKIAAVSDVLLAGSRMLDGVTGGTDSVISYLDFPRAFVGQLEGVYAKATKMANLGDTAASKFTGWQRLSAFCKGISAGGASGVKTYSVSPRPATISPATLAEVAEDAAIASGVEAGAAATVETVNPLTADVSTATAEGEAQALVGVSHAVVSAREVAAAACDILQDEAASPSLNPAEVETLVGNARARIQDAITLARVSLPAHRLRAVTESLRNAAEEVQALGAAVINARPPLVTHTIAADCNAHLLAHKLYGEYSRAAEILRLNPGITAPNFLRRGQRIIIYAE